MKIQRSTTLVALMFAAAIGAAQATLPTPGSGLQPAIQVVENRTFDFGELLRGTIAEKKVLIKNTGNEVLQLENIEASCGCTGTAPSQRSIPPGQSAVISISFNSRNFTGKVHKTVTIHSNAANEPRVVIEFAAYVIDEILLEPAHFWFKDAEVGRTSRQVMSIRNNGKEPLKITGWRCQLAGFKMTIPGEPIEPGKNAEVVAEFTPEHVSAILSEGMFLTTSNARQPEIFVPVYGNVKEFKFQ
jgi:hypothetical protein